MHAQLARLLVPLVLVAGLVGAPSRAHADDEITFVAIGGTFVFLDISFTALAATGPRGRAFGMIEVGVMAPMAAADLYAAGQTGNGGARSALYFAGAWSAALGVHGLWTILRGDGDPQRTALLGPRGTSLAPTLVSDGRISAPGLGIGGRF